VALDRRMVPGTWRAAVVLGAALAAGWLTAQPQALATSGSPVAAVVPSGALLRQARVEAGLPCPVVEVNPLLACPLPPSRAPLRIGKPVVAVCSEIAHVPLSLLRVRRPSLCGDGFQASVRVDLLAINRYGIAFHWRTMSDPQGRLGAVLPSPLCRLTPAILSATDRNGARSNAVSLDASVCPLGP